MKLNQKRITSLFKKSIATIPEIDYKDAELIFPLQVKTGFVNATEKGFVFNPNPEPTDFGRFERIFSGYEAISTVWTNSTALIPNQDNTKLFKTFVPGSAILAKMDTDNGGLEFKPMLENTNFLKEAIVSKVTYFYDKKLDEIDLFNLYIIPEKYNNVYFYITNAENFYEPGTNEFKYCKLEFSSLNDKLAQTGIAVDQYVQRSAPGEGYAWPQLIPELTEDDRREYQDVTYDNINSIPSPINLNDRFIVKDYDQNGESLITWDGKEYQIIKNAVGYILDGDALINNPVKSMQIELYTPGVLSSMYAMGRPIKKGSSMNEEIVAPRALLPYEAQTPVVSQRSITRPYSANNEYAWLSLSHLEIESFYKDWTQKVQGDWNPGVLKKWLGYLQINTNDPSNALKPSGAGRIVSDIFTFGLAEFAWNHLDDMTVNNEGVFTVKGPQTLPKMLATGYFKDRAVSRLPLDFKESIPWTLKDIPLVGGFLSKATMGLPIGWKDQKEIGGKLFNISGTISNGFYEFYKNTWMGEKRLTGQERYTGLPIEAFSDKGQPSALSPSEFSTIINMKLSDSFQEDGTISSDPNIDIVPVGRIQNTVNLGYQDMDANGVGIDGTNNKWGGKAYSVENEFADGYAIDGFGFHFLGVGDYRVLFYGEDGTTPIFTGTYKTLSKLTDSVRDWSNFIKTSNWESAIHVDNRVQMPAPALVLPISPDAVANGRTHGLLNPTLLLDAQGQPQRDVFGNLIYQTDAEGNTEYKWIEQKFADYSAPNNLLSERTEPLAVSYNVTQGQLLRDDYEVTGLSTMSYAVSIPQLFTIQSAGIKTKPPTGYDRVILSGAINLNVNGVQMGSKPVEIDLLPVNADSNTGVAQNFIISNNWVMGDNTSIDWPPMIDNNSNLFTATTAITTSDSVNGAYYWGKVFDLSKFKNSVDGTTKGSAQMTMISIISSGNVGEDGQKLIKDVSGTLSLNSVKFGFK